MSEEKEEKSDDKKKKSYLLKMSQGLYDDAVAVADRMEIDFGSFARLAIREKLDRELEKEKRRSEPKGE